MKKEETKTFSDNNRENSSLANLPYKKYKREVTAPQSQLTAEQSSTGRHWNSPKKDNPHPKTKEKPQ